jgi:hypothetical protein
MTDDERSIRELVDTWLAASKDGDLATVLSLITYDAWSPFRHRRTHPMNSSAGPNKRQLLR